MKKTSTRGTMITILTSGMVPKTDYTTVSEGTKTGKQIDIITLNYEFCPQLRTKASLRLDDHWL